MPNYDITLTITIEAKDHEDALVKVANLLTGQRRHKIVDIHIDEPKVVKA
jgi:hypothetical protein